MTSSLKEFCIREITDTICVASCFDFTKYFLSSRSRQSAAGWPGRGSANDECLAADARRAASNDTHSGHTPQGRVGRHQDQAVHTRRGRYEAVCGILGGHAESPALDSDCRSQRRLMQAESGDRLRQPSLDIRAQFDATSLGQHGDFPGADRGHPALVFGVGQQLGYLRVQAPRVGRSPDDDVSIEQQTHAVSGA